MSKLNKKFNKRKKNILHTHTPKNQKESKLLSVALEHANAGRVYLARDTYLSVLNNNPNNDRALGLLASLYAKSLEYTTAEKYLLNAIRINPKFIGYQIDLGMVYCSLHKWDKAIEINQKILQTDKDNFFALCNMGHALRGKGDLKDSIYYFKRVSELQPNFVDAYVSLCSVFHRLKMTDKLLSLLERMKSLVHSFNSAEQSVVYFTLGRYYDLFNNYDEAFSYIEKANKLKMSGVKYDLSRDVTFIKKISQQITKEFLDSNKDCGIQDTSPIFIIGMPRSGTSLIEQILSCYPEVNAGGEMQYFYVWASAFNYKYAKESCDKLATNYLQAISSIKKGSKYITDKLPHNFLYAGLIHLCLPNAKIIHCVRDPIDTCFSCYKQDFRGKHYYVYDLLSLGGYYNAYLLHMRHWHSVMPNIILDVKYEDVVNNLEEEVRRILEYCELPWNDACLKFHNSSRYVNTASRDQVAQPIYTSSVERWKHYKNYLQPLIEKLNV